MLLLECITKKSSRNVSIKILVPGLNAENIIKIIFLILHIFENYQILLREKS